ncbi:MAG: hypothetical protein KKF50_00470 [Nanoarchaeota archaeon]|nr:hypothetical protein [Nanoarchaeota archaeon]
MKCFFVRGLGGGTGVGREGEFRAGFKDGALEAEYICDDFSFRTTIPLVDRNREGALYDLAEKIVEKNVPYTNRQEVPALSISHESLSPSDLEHLSASIYCILHSDKE